MGKVSSIVLFTKREREKLVECDKNCIVTISVATAIPTIPPWLHRRGREKINAIIFQKMHFPRDSIFFMRRSSHVRCLLNFDAAPVSAKKKRQSWSRPFSQMNNYTCSEFSVSLDKNLEIKCLPSILFGVHSTAPKKRKRQINEFGSVGLCKRSRHTATARCNWIGVWSRATLQMEQRKTCVLRSVATSSSGGKYARNDLRIFDIL